MKRGILFTVLAVIALCLIACLAIVLFGNGAVPSAEPTETIPPSPTNTAIPPMPTPIVWTLEAPGGLTHALFTKGIITDESCLECVLGDLVGGTKLTPAEEGCLTSTDGPPFNYCHVRVLDGDLAGTLGWVNQDFIRR